MNLKDLLPEINLTVDQIGQKNAVRYLRSAARQFARDTSLWKRSLGTADITSPESGADLAIDVPSADYVVPAGGVIYEIAELYLDGNKVTAFPYEYNREDGQLIIHPAPVSPTPYSADGTVISDGSLEVTAVLQPARTADQLPDMFGEWEAAITSRALYEILNIPAKEWTNKDSARQFRSRYHEQVGEAKVDVARGGTTRAIRTTHREFV